MRRDKIVNKTKEFLFTCKCGITDFTENANYYIDESNCAITNNSTATCDYCAGKVTTNEMIERIHIMSAYRKYFFEKGEVFNERNYNKHFSETIKETVTSIDYLKTL